MLRSGVRKFATVVEKKSEGLGAQAKHLVDWAQSYATLIGVIGAIGFGVFKIGQYSVQQNADVRVKDAELRLLQALSAAELKAVQSESMATAREAEVKVTDRLLLLLFASKYKSLQEKKQFESPKKQQADQALRED